MATGNATRPLFEIEGYRSASCILKGPRLALYRGTRIRDGIPVLLKTMARDFPMATDLARFRHDLEIATAQKADCIPDILSVEPGPNGPVQVLEDFPGRPLAPEPGQFDPDRFFPLAIALARGLFRLHRQGVIHNNLDPAYVLADPATGRIMFADLGSAEPLDEARPRSAPLHRLDEDVLPYLSPEQTGRLRQGIDQRSDLYSLGIILYELITGAAPFTGPDPLEIIHGHLARIPPAPHALDPRVPAPLSAVVLKLLAKHPEDRYRTAYGPIRDLEACREAPAGSAFLPGRFDFSDRLVPPAKPVGRLAEAERLEHAYDAAARGFRHALFVQGVSGVGKTTLLKGFRDYVEGRGGIFAGGKFDPLRQDLPYGAILQALRDILARMRDRFPAGVGQWKKRLEERLGDHAQVLADLLPELESVLGRRPVAPGLGPTESRNRFHLLVHRFLGASAEEGRPLVFALEDLQWADPDSLRLLESLLERDEEGHVLIMGSFRPAGKGEEEEEANVSLEKLSGKTPSLRLEPFSAEETLELVAATMPNMRSDPEGLSRLVHLRAGGNPLFALEWIKRLQADRLVRFEFPSLDQAGEGTWGWHWDMNDIRSYGLKEGLADLVQARIGGLGQEARDILSDASCLGTRFDLGMLSHVREASPEDILDGLREAIDERIVVPLFREPGIPPSAAALPEGVAQAGDRRLEFAHDRVQEAAHALLTAGRREKVHLRAGLRYQEAYRENGSLENLFGATRHLSEAVGHFRTDEDRYALAELNLAACRRSKATAAFGQGLAALRTAIALLPPEAWNERSALAFGIHSELAESEALAGRLPEAERFFDLALRHAQGKLAKAQVYGTKMKVWMHQGRDAAGIALGLEALEQLGMKVPAKPGMPALLSETLLLKLRLAGRSPASLADLPDRTSEGDRAAMDILMNVWGTAHWLNQNLEGLVILKMVGLSLSKGNSDVSPVAYACFGAITAIVFKDFRQGLDFGNLAMSLAEKRGLPQIRCRVYFIYGTFHGPLCRPNRDNALIYREAFRLSLESGDLLYAGACCDALTSTLPLSAASAAEVSEGISGNRDFIHKAEAKRSLTVTQIVERWLEGLERAVPEDFGAPGRGFAIDIFQESAGRFEIEKGVFYLYELQSACLYGSYARAWELALKLDVNPIGKGHPVIVAFCHFFPAMAALNHAGCPPATRARRVKLARRWLRKLAGFYPPGFSHLAELLEAEIARTAGDILRAEAHYDAAIALAEANGYPLIAAWGEELAGLAEISRGRHRSGRAYLTGACHRYLLWGAHAKAIRLAERHRLPQSPAQTGWIPKPDAYPKQDSFDLMTVIKASHAISGELILDRLLARLVRIILESAGARKCFLVLEQKGELKIQGEGYAESGEVRVLQRIPLEQCGRLSQGIVLHVARQEQTLLLGDASADPNFKDDPYVRAHAAKSILCMPMLHQSKIKGILYLENELMRDAFGPERLGILNLIATQAAISLETAGLHALQLEALQAKINPHFLFNAISSITELIYTDPASAETAMTKLAGLYRYILASSADAAVPLFRELEIVRNYLNLEKLRFGAKLDFEIIVEGDLAGVQIPCLVLQPLAENSVQHGIAPKQGPGKVSVLAAVSGKRCRIVVADDGIGWSTARPGNGFGLKNVQERLSMLFGDEYSLSIDSGEGGVVIEMSIPLHGASRYNGEGISHAA
jgi:predicted ATPase